MFQVHRYDPRKEDKTKKTKNRRGKKDDNGRRGKRRRKGDQNKDDASAPVKVIAPDQEKTDANTTLFSKRMIRLQRSDEAFDDLDLTDDVILSREKKDDAHDDDDEHDDDNLMHDDEHIVGCASPNHIDFDLTDEIERALYMTTLPIVEAARRWGLADFLVQNLQTDGYQHFFPIQALVIPDVILAERHMGSLQTRDICCAAPTGSGKTLAFVIPVLNALANRKIRRLRALVVLPSRDLAQQVYNVFQRYSEGSDLKIGLAIGQTNLQAEQRSLILGDNEHESDDYMYPCLPHLKHVMNPGNLGFELDAMADELENGFSETSQRKKLPAGGISAVDVLVCTPGRLVDHLDNTPAFTLQHLRFLVVDEADRLLSQSYHGWIHKVLENVHATPPEVRGDATTHLSIEPVTYRQNAHEDRRHAVTSYRSRRSTICQRIQLRKMLYSATLTKDPQKLASLRLVNTKFFHAHNLKRKRKGIGGGEKSEDSLYRMPDQLQEQIVECTAEQKPLVLLALLLERLQESNDGADLGKEKKLIVVFTSSLESTHRLTRLLQLLWHGTGYSHPPVEFSSLLNQSQRSQLMEQCNDPNNSTVSVLVCSDGMSRGMDLSSVRVVIHYDVPSMSKTYVHRCGRTARANQDGQAIALLKGKGQVGQFTRLRRLIANPERVTKASVKTSLVRDLIPLYKQSIVRLKKVLAAESREELKPLDLNLSKFLSKDGSDNDTTSEESSNDVDPSDSDNSS